MSLNSPFKLFFYTMITFFYGARPMLYYNKKISK